MSSQQTSQKERTFLGIISIVLGLFPIAIGTEIVKVDPATVHAPLWVLLGCGLVFVLTGLMLIFGERYPWFNHLCAAFWLVFMGAIAGWIALFGKELSGGIPFIPHNWNLLLGRYLIGFGSILCFSLAVYALQQFWKTKSK